MKWIKTKDRLPDIREEVLTFGEDEYNNKSFYIAWIEKFGIENKPSWQYSWCCGCYCSNEITHWSKLPEPPNEN